jgi:endonuclease/exonuclease/phosphatase family metal-dependent hydrolase
VRPDRRIDGAFATSGVEVVGYDVVDDHRAAVGSDHRPVLVTVRVPSA